MQNKILCVLLLAASIGLFGCSSTPMPPSIKIMRFDPVINSPNIDTFTSTELSIKGETMARYTSPNYKIQTAVFEALSIMIVPITIVNNTGDDLQPSNYSISLEDGRDMKTIKMLSRSEMIKIQDKLKGGTGSGLEQQVINTAVDSFMDITNSTDKQDVIRGLDAAINNYFAFRPVYAYDKRFGVLCFLLDFKAEYPISLRVKIHKQDVILKFFPKVDTK